jgi:hypothetical protein
MGFDQYGSGQPQQRFRVGEHPDDVGAAFHLFVEPLERVGNRYERPTAPPVPSASSLVRRGVVGLRCDRPGQGRRE